MRIRTIDWPNDRDALLAHFEQVYGPEQVATLTASYGTTPGFDPADCFVIDGDGGVIVAHAMIIPRQVQIGASRLPTAELGEISVLDAYRDHGFQDDLLAALHARMTEREDALGLTFAAPDGFAAWQYVAAAGLYLTSFESLIYTEQALAAGTWDFTHSYERRSADRLGAHDTNATVRRFYIDDLPAVQNLYAAESARGHYLLARSEADWRWQFDHLARTGRYDPDDFLVAEIGGRLVAYARMVVREAANLFRQPIDDTPFSVIESGGTHPDGVEALFGTIAHTARTLGSSQIGLFVHPDSALMRHALVRGASLRHFTGAAFLRLHSLPITLELLRPTLDRRCADSRFADRAFDIYIATEHEEAVILLGQDTADEVEVVELEIPSSALLRLITGWYGVDHLDASYPARYADLLRVLFPQRDPKIGLADVL